MNTTKEEIRKTQEIISEAERIELKIIRQFITPLGERCEKIKSSNTTDDEECRFADLALEVIDYILKEVPEQTILYSIDEAIREFDSFFDSDHENAKSRIIHVLKEISEKYKGVELRLVFNQAYIQQKGKKSHYTAISFVITQVHSYDKISRYGRGK